MPIGKVLSSWFCTHHSQPAIWSKSFQRSTGEVGKGETPSFCKAGYRLPEIKTTGKNYSGGGFDNFLSAFERRLSHRFQRRLFEFLHRLFNKPHQFFD
jgi:hypothetical protein